MTPHELAQGPVSKGPPSWYYNPMNQTTKTMTKLTPAQAYALQVKADRRQAALERIQDPLVQAEVQRINELYVSGSLNKRTQPQEPQFEEAKSFTVTRLPGGAKASKAAEKAAATRRRNRKAK